VHRLDPAYRRADIRISWRIVGGLSPGSEVEVSAAFVSRSSAYTLVLWSTERSTTPRVDGFQEVVGRDDEAGEEWPAASGRRGGGASDCAKPSDKEASNEIVEPVRDFDRWPVIDAFEDHEL
jgi:hypothetical protein